MNGRGFDRTAQPPPDKWRDKPQVEQRPGEARDAVADAKQEQEDGKCDEWREPHDVEESEDAGLGAAMCAAAGAGWFPNVAAAAGAMSGEVTDAAEPNADRMARYAELLEIYGEIYPRLRDTFGKIAAFQRSTPA